MTSFKTLQGLRWNSISMIASVLLQLLQIAILSRFLSPEDFGLIGLYSLAYGLVGIFVGFGIVKALIHKSELTRKELNSVFWFNLLRAGIFGILLYLIAKPLADFYHSKNLPSLLLYGCITYVLIAIGQVHNALLQKKLRFFHYALCEIISTISGVIVSIVLAFQGKRAEAYIIGTVTQHGVRSAMSILFIISSFFPSFSISIKSLQFFFRFGIFQAGNDIFHFFIKNLDEFFIGKWFPIGVFGTYVIGKRLPFRFSQVVNPVITTTLLPLFSKVQNFPSYLQNAYLSTLSNLFSFTLPIYAFMVLFAKEIVLLFFGEGWEKAAPILQLVAIWNVPKDFLYLTGLMIYVKGRTDFAFWWSMVSLVLFTLLFSYFNHIDLFFLLWIVILIQIFLIPLNWRLILYPLIRISFKSILTHILRPLSLVSLVAFVTYIVKTALNFYTSLNFVYIMLCSTIWYCLLVFTFYYFFNRNFVEMFFQLIGIQKFFVR